MRTRIEITDEMVERYLDAAEAHCDKIYGPGWYSRREGIARAGLEAALSERRTSERRKGLQVGAYAPEGNTAKGEDGAAPAKPAAVEGMTLGDMVCVHGVRLANFCDRCGSDWVVDRRASDRHGSGGTDPSSLPSPQDATRDNARPCNHLWAFGSSTGGMTKCLFCGATHAPSQDTTRPSASTTPAAPEVSRAMRDLGGIVYKACRDEEWRSKAWSVNDFAERIFRAMYLKMLSENKAS